MSHRKYEHPRNGSLAFLPRKRTKHHRGRIRHFPRDDQAAKPHLTAFMGYKAGSTHVLREVDRPGSGLHKHETVEQVTILETPPMKAVGLVGYVETPRGLRTLTTVWANHLDESVKRRFYKNFMSSKKKAFKNYEKKVTAPDNKRVANELERMRKYCQVIRLLVHTDIRKVSTGGQKKAHLIEVQINGGNTKAKVDFGYGLFEKAIPVDTVLSQDEMIDTLGSTKGCGFTGVVTRWHVKRLPRKTHRGLRKVACIGSWHPQNIHWSVARAGQMGYHHRTEMNKKIYRIGKASKGANGEFVANATTEHDLTVKAITPMGGFPHYGVVDQDYVMIKGTCPGKKKRVITLRKTMVPHTRRSHHEKIELKFIDTSSKFGHGRFQTAAEKSAFLGASKPAEKAPEQ